MTNISKRRQEIIGEMVGEEIPRLWCPPLTHYTADGSIDQTRMAAHWRFMTPHVKSFLVPGSTGDAWEMQDAEVRAVVDLALMLAEETETRLLLGALKEDASATRRGIEELLVTLLAKTGEDDPVKAMRASRVCGFVVCPPGGSALTQREMEAGLERVLDLGLPTALYQLPQMTDNEMSPSLVARLADHHANLILFKDSSGDDRVALGTDGPRGLFLTRGAEGRYAQWLQEGGGSYDGLLLSTANCFPGELRAVIDLLEGGAIDEGVALSDRLTQAVEQVFTLVGDIPDGNPFANANKAMDHYRAFGADGRTALPPRLHAGTVIPKEILLKTGDVLESLDLIPERGYLDR